MHMDELKNLIEGAGVVGAGGAGFPTHIKMSDKVDTVIINAAECEPLLSADFFILKQAFSVVVNGIKEVLEAIGGETDAYIALKEHNATKLGLCEHQQISEHIYIKVLPNVYPMGDEVVLVYETTGRIVPPGGIPLMVNTIVMNAETIYNIAEAVSGQKVTHTFLTIAGEGITTTTIKAAVGSLAADVINHYVSKETGKTVDFDNLMIVDGGPMMGRVVDPYTHHITKTTKGLLLLPPEGRVAMLKNASAEGAVKRAGSSCCQCRMCTDLCPRHLLGYEIEPHKIMRSVAFNRAEASDILLNASICSQCGVCEALACCQNLSPKKVCGELKKQFGKNGIKYSGPKNPPAADKFREYRMASSDRLVERLGLSRYAKKDSIFEDEIYEPTSVKIALRQHLGAPAVPCVNIGDQVTVGDMIAVKAENGLSANIHASISGNVTEITADYIAIDGRAQK